MKRQRDPPEQHEGDEIVGGDGIAKRVWQSEKSWNKRNDDNF